MRTRATLNPCDPDRAADRQRDGESAQLVVCETADELFQKLRGNAEYLDPSMRRDVPDKARGKRVLLWGNARQEAEMDIEKLKAVGPTRRGSHVWKAVERLVARHIADGEDFEQMVLGWQNYARHCRQTGSEGTEFVMMARTFFGRDMHWLEWAELDLRTPAQVAQDTKWAALEDRARALGFNTVDRQRGYDVALRAVEQAERDNARKVVQQVGLKLQVVR